KTEYIEQLGSGIGPVFCFEPGLGQGRFEYTVTHPAGAQAKFTFDVMRHYRIGVPWGCQREIAPHLTLQIRSAGAQLDAMAMREVLWRMVNLGENAFEAIGS